MSIWSRLKLFFTSRDAHHMAWQFAEGFGYETAEMLKRRQALLSDAYDQLTKYVKVYNNANAVLRSRQDTPDAHHERMRLIEQFDKLPDDFDLRTRLALAAKRPPPLVVRMWGTGRRYQR